MVVENNCFGLWNLGSRDFTHSRKRQKRSSQYLAVLQLLHQHFETEKEVENSKKLIQVLIKDVDSNNK